MVDTHTHIYEAAFSADIDAVIGRAREAGVEWVVLPATSPKDCAAVDDLCQRHPDFCRPLYGLHPTEMGPAPLREAEEVLRFGEEHGTAGVGEVGLDLHWDGSRLQEQLDVLRLQLDYAAARDLPVSLHCREALPQLLELLEQMGGRVPRLALHCYAGSREQALDIVRRWPQISFGFGGSSTYKNSRLPATAAALPAERLLTETDAPYLTPAPHRGQRNEPAFIPIIIGVLAAARGCSPDELAQATANNAQRLFGAPSNHSEALTIKH